MRLVSLLFVGVLALLLATEADASRKGPLQARRDARHLDRLVVARGVIQPVQRLPMPQQAPLAKPGKK